MERASPAQVHVLEPVEQVIRAILLCGIAVSVALMAAGLVLGVALGAGLPRGVVPLAELPRALVALRPAAYLSLGLIVLDRYAVRARRGLARRLRQGA